MSERPADVPDVLIRQPRVKAIEPDPLRVGAGPCRHTNAGSAARGAVSGAARK